MSDITTSGTGTSNRTRKPSDTLHPHYFNSFQNYASGPKAKIISSPLSSSSSNNQDYLPIPEPFKIRADAIINIINQALVQHIQQITRCTSILPREFFEQDSINDYQKYFIDRTMFKTMSDAGVINWMISMKSLYPVRTSGNGNCLLHAVLIAMVGTHDFSLHLRDCLRTFMSANNTILKDNWKIERLKTDKMYGIQSEEAKFDSEWNELCDLVRYDNTDDGQTASNLEFLEGVHIFSLSNLLSRPIIILSEDVVRNKHGEAISVNDLYGIYLPTLCQSSHIVKEPIVLAYDQSHFCPLQTNDYATTIQLDNCLPLYQSVEHARKQILLPIRFYGNEISFDESYRLLNRFLSIKKLAFYPDKNQSGIPVLCTELGCRRFTSQDHFFLLFYEYLKDFFEIQKKKLKEQEAAEEEEEQKRKQEQDYYYQTQSYPELTQRNAIKPDVSSSPPPPYSSVVTRKSTINERRPSYDEAVNNGNAYVSNSNSNHHSNLQKTPSTTQSIQSHQNVNDISMHSTKQPTVALSNWDANQSEMNYNEKPVGYNNANYRTTDSKLKQETQYSQQKSTRIPIQTITTDSTAPNLIDFDRSTDRFRPCIVCKTLFDDSSATGLCHDCDYKKHFPQQHVVIRRAPQTYIYPTHAYPASDFISSKSSPIKSRGPLKIVCPHCKNINMITYVNPNLAYACSKCSTVLRT